MATPTNLPASFSTGAVLTAAQMNDLRGAFRVLQIVTATYATQTSSSTSTYTDTGLSATITPSATSSKILVFINQDGCGKQTNNTYGRLRLLRGTTQILTFGNGFADTGNTDQNNIGTVSAMYLGSPATTSATTYKTQFQSVNNSAIVYVQIGSDNSSICLMEKFS